MPGVRRLVPVPKFPSKAQEKFRQLQAFRQRPELNPAVETMPRQTFFFLFFNEKSLL